MTHKEHAEKVWEDAHCAFAEGALEGGGTEDAVSIIAAALEKQREACAEAWLDSPNGITLQKRAILNAEVKINKEKEGKE